MQMPEKGKQSEKGNEKGKGKGKQNEKSRRNRGRRGSESDSSDTSDGLGGKAVFKGNRPVTDDDDDADVAKSNRTEKGEKGERRDALQILSQIRLTHFCRQHVMCGANHTIRWKAVDAIRWAEQVVSSHESLSFQLKQQPLAHQSGVIQCRKDPRLDSGVIQAKEGHARPCSSTGSDRLIPRPL